MKDLEVTARKIVVYGKNLESLQFFVKYGSELTEAPVSDMEVTDEKVTIWFSRAITPDAFRFEFNEPLGGQITLYEIEAF